MRATMNRWGRFELLPLALAPLLLAGPAHAAPVEIDLCVKQGTITVPDGPPVTIWGYVEKIPTAGCAGPAHVAQLPGPVIRVQAGDVVTIRIRNGLGVNTSILIPGQEVSVVTGGIPGLFTKEATPGSQNTRYEFTAKPGTYIYESGTDPEIQVPMGLHGALVVESATPGQAYDQPTSQFDTEAVLVLSEIDPALHADPSGFDPQDYDPIYWLINGKAFPETDGIVASAGDRVLLRYVNASFTHHAMAGLDFHQRVIAREAFELPSVTQAVAETIAAGTTLDAITTIRANAALISLFPLYNRNMRLTNASSNDPGGMQTAIEVQPLFFSTAGNGAVPGVPAGTAGAHDDADLYKWNSRSFTRVFEARVSPAGAATNLAANANIDGLKVVDADTFYVSFSLDGIALPGTALTAADEDIVLYDAGTWSVYFDGSAAGLDTLDAALNIDAFDIDLATGTIYFSTAGNVLVPNVPAGTPAANAYDDADIYAWDALNGFTRVFEARVNGGAATNLPVNANIDGLKFIDTNTFYLSFSLDSIALPGGGTAADEDIVLYDGVTWSVFFDGSEAGSGLTAGTLDIDAFDLP